MAKIGSGFRRFSGFRTSATLTNSSLSAKLSIFRHLTARARGCCPLMLRPLIKICLLLFAGPGICHENDNFILLRGATKPDVWTLWCRQCKLKVNRKLRRLGSTNRFVVVDLNSDSKFGRRLPWDFNSNDGFKSTIAILI